MTSGSRGASITTQDWRFVDLVLDRLDTTEAGEPYTLAVIYPGRIC
jgi:hypothetical protein